MVYWVCFQLHGSCFYHDMCLGMFMGVARYSEFARPHHTKILATTRETLLAWVTWSQHRFHTHGWCVIASVVRSISWSWAHQCVPPLPRCPDVLWAHRAAHPYVTSPGPPEPLPFLKPTYSLFWYSSVAWFLGLWASTCHSFPSVFSTWVLMSYHNAAAQMGLPLHC